MSCEELELSPVLSMKGIRHVVTKVYINLLEEKESVVLNKHN